MKNSIKILSAFFVLSFISSACIKDDHGEKLEAEHRLLQQFIIDKQYNVEPTWSGLYYIEISEGTGISPSPGDYVLINFTGRLLAGEKVFGTTDYSVAELNNLFDTNFLYGPMLLPIDNISPNGIREGIFYMKEGGESRMIFPSTLGYGNTPVASIPAYSSLIYDVELLEVISNPVEYEKQKIQQYLTDNLITIQPNEEGLYYIENSEGTGQRPSLNGIVEIQYTGKLLDGRIVISTSENHQVNLGGYLQGIVNQALTVKGLRDAVRLMKVSGTATVIVPHDLAFGDNTVNASALGYKYPISPYSTIIYEVTLVSVK